MLKIFICTNINQLINFYLTSEIKSPEVVVCIKNKLLSINSYNQIKIYARKLNYKFGINLEMHFNSKVDLISRIDLNVDELNYINNFIINDWYVVEDGLVDYMLKYKFNLCSSLYGIIRIQDKIYALISKIINEKIKNKKRSFKFNKKISNILICQNASNSEFLIKIHECDFLKKNRYKVIIVGSLYNNFSKNFSSFYDLMMEEAKKRSIKSENILYIPHPRQDTKNIDSIFKKYSWSIDKSGFPAEKIILENKNTILWSTCSTSIIYMKILFNYDCQLFFLKNLKEYISFKSYIKFSSIYCFFKSIGCTIIKK